MAQKSRTISSMEELMQAVPQIIEAANADPSLALRFAANPLFLAEELGYKLSVEMHHFAARRMRFRAETFERMVVLEKQVWELAGEPFDLDSGEALERVLFTKLKLPRSQAQPKEPRQPKKSKADAHQAELQRQEAYAPDAAQAGPVLLAAPLPPRAVGHGHIADPLEALHAAHPVIAPLLEYRQLEASSARLAPRALYERIGRGDVKLPITRLQMRLKITPKP